MTFTQNIPADRLAGVDVQEGDTLHVIALRDAAFVVQVSRPEEGKKTTSPAGAWLRSAKGSVRLDGGETADDVRRDFHNRKHSPAG